VTGGNLSLVMSDSMGDIQPAKVCLSTGFRIFTERLAWRERYVMERPEQVLRHFAVY
jgi:hypothetical protein